MEGTLKFESVEKLIYGLCWKAQQRTGLEFDELLSDAYLHYADASRTFDPEKGVKFSTWVYRKVSWGLARRDSDRKHRPKIDPGFPNLGEIVSSRPEFSLEKFISELSADSQTVLRALFDAPETRKSAGRRNFVVRFLSEMGWAMERIAESFSEIRGAL